MESFVELWEMVREELKASLSEAIFNVWIDDLEFVSFDASRVILSLGEFKRKVVEQKFYDVICRAFEKVLGFKVDVEIIDPKSSQTVKNKQKEMPERYEEYTFRTFVVGPSNKFAHAAALSVAENPGQSYNPLFIYGNSGLGKTHLLNAICHEITSNNPGLKYVFTHGEDFTNEIVQHLAQKNMADFHNKYRNLDLLIVDDVQFIAGKPST